MDIVKIGALLALAFALGGCAAAGHHQMHHGEMMGQHGQAAACPTNEPVGEATAAEHDHGAETTAPGNEHAAAAECPRASDGAH
jgi:hypothetical protein